MGCEPSSSSLSTLKTPEPKKLGDATNCRVSRKKAAEGREGSGNPRFGSILSYLGFLGSSDDKESACNAGDPGSITRSGRSPGEGKGYPRQYSGLENSMDCVVHGVAKSQTRLSDFHSLASSHPPRGSIHVSL